MLARCAASILVIFTSTNYYYNYFYNSTTPMAAKNTFACQDNRPQYREEMEVDAPVENVEQVEEQPKEPEPEKIVSRYGCPSE